MTELLLHAIVFRHKPIVKNEIKYFIFSYIRLQSNPCLTITRSQPIVRVLRITNTVLNNKHNNYWSHNSWTKYQTFNKIIVIEDKWESSVLFIEKCLVFVNIDSNVLFCSPVLLFYGSVVLRGKPLRARVSKLLTQLSRSAMANLPLKRISNNQPRGRPPKHS